MNARGESFQRRIVWCMVEILQDFKALLNQSVRMSSQTARIDRGVSRNLGTRVA